MTRKNDKAVNQGVLADPQEWKTGDERMTAAQESYLHTLAREAGEPVEEEMTKAEASERIDELRHKTARDESSRPAAASGTKRRKRKGG